MAKNNEERKHWVGLLHIEEGRNEKLNDKRQALIGVKKANLDTLKENIKNLERQYKDEKAQLNKESIFVKEQIEQSNRKIALYQVNIQEIDKDVNENGYETQTA